ncbi:hypothetical protein ACA910_021897 [Epithemia clementina (nom. ined.)]
MASPFVGSMSAPIVLAQIIYICAFWLTLSHAFAPLSMVPFMATTTSRSLSTTKLLSSSAPHRYHSMTRPPFLTSSTTGVTSLVILSASSQEEDLELTRQIILGHLKTSPSAEADTTSENPTAAANDDDAADDKEDDAPPQEPVEHSADEPIEEPASSTEAEDAVLEESPEAEADTMSESATTDDDKEDDAPAPDPEDETTSEPIEESAKDDDAPAQDPVEDAPAQDPVEETANESIEEPTASAEATSPETPVAASFSSNVVLEERPRNDLMIRAALGQDVEMTPVWLFRQAGRHLPEYQAYKEKLGKSFLELLASPESVAECTMQPLRRYNVDAAILFSDILVVPQALGIQVTMPGGVGIQVPSPLQDPSEIATRLPSLSDITPQFVQDKLGHVLAAVQQIRVQMAEERKSIPLIGFSAAPWTLFFYMVGGSSKKNTDAGIKWMEDYPEDTQALLQLLTRVVIEYMAAQVDAGAHMLQVFEAMGMMMGSDDNFKTFALPCLQQIAQELKQRYPDIPLMVFARGACHMNGELSKLGYNVVTIDGSTDRATARQAVQTDGSSRVTLQGNYDPAELIEANGKTVQTVRMTAKQLLMELGPQQLIANLGEGLGGKESPQLVETFVHAIHAESAAMIRIAKQEAATAAAAAAVQTVAA